MNAPENPNKILIIQVDDNERLNHVLKPRLEAAGYDVENATNGQEAFNLISNLSPEQRSRAVLITDLNMPRLNGVQLLEKLTNENLRLPSIMHTGDVNGQVIAERLIREGKLDSYLDNVCSFDEMLAAIAPAIQHFTGDQPNSSVDSFTASSNKAKIESPPNPAL